MALLRDAERMPETQVEGLTAPADDADSVHLGRMLLVSYPPKRRLSFSLEKVVLPRYHRRSRCRGGDRSRPLGQSRPPSCRNSQAMQRRRLGRSTRAHLTSPLRTRHHPAAMHTIRFLALTFGVALGVLPHGTPLRPADSARDQVWAAEVAFARSMAERNAQAFADLIADEAVFFAGTTALRGKAKVVEGWAGFFTDKEAPFSWAPDQVEVLASGTLALSTGLVRDPAGKTGRTLQLDLAAGSARTAGGWCSTRAARRRRGRNDGHGPPPGHGSRLKERRHAAPRSGRNAPRLRRRRRGDRRARRLAHPRASSGTAGDSRLPARHAAGWPCKAGRATWCCTRSSGWRRWPRRPYLERLNRPTPWTDEDDAALPRHEPRPVRGRRERRARARATSASPSFRPAPGAGAPGSTPGCARRSWRRCRCGPASAALICSKGELAPPMTNEQRIRGADAGVGWALLVTGYRQDARRRPGRRRSSSRDGSRPRAHVEVATALYRCRPHGSSPASSGPENPIAGAPAGPAPGRHRSRVDRPHRQGALVMTPPLCPNGPAGLRPRPAVLDGGPRRRSRPNTTLVQKSKSSARDPRRAEVSRRDARLRQPTAARTVKAGSKQGAPAAGEATPTAERSLRGLPGERRRSLTPQVTLRLMTEQDLPLLHEWLQRPHIVEWWGGEAGLLDSSPRPGPATFPRVLAEERVTPYIALAVATSPIGYAQSYVALGSGRRLVEARNRSRRARHLPVARRSGAARPAASARRW